MVLRCTTAPLEEFIELRVRIPPGVASKLGIPDPTVSGDAQPAMLPSDTLEMTVQSDFHRLKVPITLIAADITWMAEDVRTGGLSMLQQLQQLFSVVPKKKEVHI